MDTSSQSTDVKRRAKTAYDSFPVVWPETDQWSSHTSAILDAVVHRFAFDPDQAILNAGCGGNDYGLGEKAVNWINLDISFQQCRNMRRAIVADVESIPLANDLFDVVLCIGAVLNYCDPYTALPELFRVAKPGARILIDFETTHSAELLFSTHWGKRVSVIERAYAGRPDKTFLFSEDHIRRVIESSGGRVVQTERYHTATAVWLRIAPKERIPGIVLSLDRFLSRVPLLNAVASNSICLCQKL